MTQAIYSVKAIREIEQAVMTRLSLSGFTLMQRAGQAVFDVMMEYFNHVKKIAVVCGGGNNGGDGYVFAQVAHLAGFVVTVWHVGDVGLLKGEAKTAFENAQVAGVEMKPWQADMESPDLIVDALLGIGIQGELREDALTVIQAINSHQVKVLAIDVPSGVNAESGYVDKLAVKADVTVTFIGMKRGLLTGSALNFVGKVIVRHLDIDQETLRHIQTILVEISTSDLLLQLQARPINANKKHFGHVLVIAGNQGFSGAARMAAEAALSVGAGLVTVATHPAHAVVINVGRPELMVTAVSTEKALAPMLTRATVIVVGPGLGRDDWGHAMLHAALTSNYPMVVDADGLNMLSEKQQHQSHWILTPHEGEAARLLGCEVRNVSKDRFEAIMQIQHRYGGVCVLKGAGSLVYNGKTMQLCKAGNPGMATAGMGDVLSGVISGLLAQQMDLFSAASLGVALHAQAGDLAASYGQRGLCATDLFPYLRQLINE